MNPDLSNDPLPDYLKMFAAQLGITTTNPECIRRAIADLKLQNSTNANLAENAIRASKNSTQSIEAIAAQLGIDFNGNTEQIHEAIANLKKRSKIAIPLMDMAEYTAMLLDVSLEKFLDQYSSMLFDIVDIHRNVARFLDIQSIPMLVNKSGILGAIADLKSNAATATLLEAFAKETELINAIATELNLTDFEDEDLIRQVKAERQAKECAMLAAKERGASLDAIAEMLDVTFTGNTDDIYEAIALLKKSNKAEARINPLGDLHKRLADALNLGNVFDDDDILEAIANLKRSIELCQQEVSEIQKSKQREDHWHKKYTDLQAEFEQAYNHHDELCSERDYYRSILDKLCDRLNVPTIEALEHAAKYQEMDLDFTSQHNEDLVRQLAESQTISYKYVSRIIELENEVRSLKDPVPDSDRLTYAELIQIVRSLLKSS